MSNIANEGRCELSFESLRMTKEGEEVKFNFLWTIKKFSARPQEIGERLCSSMFHIQAPEDIKSDWEMQLLPKGYYHFSPSTTGINTSVRNFLSVCVNNYSEKDFLAKTKLSILDEARKRHYQKNGNSRDEWEKYDNGHGPLELLSLNKLHSEASVLLPNDCLMILCEVTILIPDKNTPVSVDGDVKTVLPGQANLLNNLESVFLNKEFTDVQIQCGDKVFECHQFMLSVQSPIFKAMFQVEMKEKNTKKVVVKDIRPDVLEEMLTFIYTGKCPNVDNLTRGLLGAADKYQVELLKTICIEKLCNRIDVKNCVDYLIIGDMYQADLLKKISLDFIAKNVGNICDLAGWKESLLGNSSLMADVLEAIGRKDIRGTVTHESEEYH